ncbi:hypothetical protein SAMN03097708_03309 [Thiohalomonas denitrificans]|uniref:Uncharacterized protein n=1 Tax=Thiohalomonas denitrificans TaxID=415747 RepID=A0A1G5R2Q6_9GAMM|nr:hypothetical protein SAMN03097708_03309 [Thiohalomonas denitrificans]
MVFGELDSAFSLAERIGKWVKRRNIRAYSEETVSARFVCLFENHGVHRRKSVEFLYRRVAPPLADH